MDVLELLFVDVHIGTIDHLFHRAVALVSSEVNPDRVQVHRCTGAGDCAAAIDFAIPTSICLHMETTQFTMVDDTALQTTSTNANCGRLKRFLFRTPQASNFKFSSNTRTEIRKQIFLSVSNEGQFLDYFFPNTPLELKAEPHLSQELAKVVDTEYEWLFSKYFKSMLQLRDPKLDTHNHHAFHANAPCARIFRKGEPIYKCLTCGFDDTCALCSHCYQPDFHEGHKVHLTICQRENGGVCDCGDPEAWVKEFSCPYADASALPPVKEIPDKLAESILATLETLLDYIIDVMCHSSFEYDPEEDFIQSTETFRLDPSHYAFLSDANIHDFNPDKYYLMAHNDQVRHYRDAMERIHLTSKKTPQFARMVTDRVQTYGKAKVISSSNISILKERQKMLSSTGLATSIRSARDVFREDMCDEILIWLNDFTECDLFKTNNRVKDLFCRAFCGRWKCGIPQFANDTDLELDATALGNEYTVGNLDSRLMIPKVPSLNTSTNPTKAHWSFQPSPWNLDEQISIQCDYNLNTDDYDPSRSHRGSRLQYLLYLDIRFWKSIRTMLHDMYSNALITNLHYKNIVCCQYVDIYPAIADMYLTIDREPEINIMCTLATQLFTCPTNSTSIVQHGDVSRIFAAIFGFLTVEHIISPLDVDLSREVSLKSLKNRRWGQIFFDIGYILSRSKDSKTILTSDIVPMACDILALFQGTPVMKRESKVHVEYESPDYSAFFFAIVVIYQFAEYIAHCLNNLTELEAERRKWIFENVLSYVIRFLIKIETGLYPHSSQKLVDVKITRDKFVPEVSTDGFVLQNYRIDKEKVSFLHPLHSFLSWLIELSRFENPEELQRIIRLALDSIPSGLAHPGYKQYLTSLFEYPLRTIVLMSQIKAGLWVRNGFSVRTQLQLYSNSGLRETGYLRDLFLTQVFVSSTSPDLSCNLILNRWLFDDHWSITQVQDQDEDDEFPYEPKILPYMLEECVGFLINVQTETLYLRGLRGEEVTNIRLQNEIIHNLCFSPISYTKLCSQIPDHVTSEKRFDLVLDELSNFTPPIQSNDTGVYKLKEKYMNCVNPYYFNYSANTRDDAMKFVKDRIHKKTGKPKSEVVIEPQKCGECLGTYQYIGNFAASAQFSKFLVKILHYVTNEEPNKNESLIESTLHLIHICSMEHLINTESYGGFYIHAAKKHDEYDSSVILAMYNLLCMENAKRFHCKIRRIFQIMHEKCGKLVGDLLSQIILFNESILVMNENDSYIENEYETKKKMAKERQRKLMEKFKKQQSLFLKNHEGEGSASSDMEMEDLDTEQGWKFPEPHCLLCQNALEDAGPFGIITYITKSSEFREVPFNDPYWFFKSFSDSENLNENETGNSNLFSRKWVDFMNQIKQDHVIGPGFTKGAVDSKLVSTSCGHGMHFQCYLNYIASNNNKQNQITRNAPETVEHKEFLCPLCKAINNMFFPILWTPNRRSFADFVKPSEYVQFGSLHDRVPWTFSPFDMLEKVGYEQSWFNSFCELARRDISDINSLTEEAKTIIASNGTTVTPEQQQFRALLSNMFQVLSLLTFPHIFKADSTIMLVNSIKSTEISLRGTQAPNGLVFSQLSNNSLINLRTLNEFRNTSLLMKTQNWIHSPKPRNDAYVKVLAQLLLLSSLKVNNAILEKDFFELLVSVVPLRSTEFSFNTLLRTCYFCHIIQCFNLLVIEVVSKNFYMTLGISILDIPVIHDISEETALRVLSLYEKVKLNHTELTGSNSSIEENPLFGKVLYSMLIKSVTPFLRQSAIYAFVYCSDIDNINVSEDIKIEAEMLTSVLQIDSIDLLLRKMNGEIDSFELDRFMKFLSYIKNTSPALETVNLKKSLEYPGVVLLADLPERLDHFFTKYYYLDKYDNPHMTIEDPAVCLFCGDVVDAQKPAVGCKEGQCTTHFLKECANNFGIFLLPKERCLLLLHKNGGSFHTAPFLDLHGELPAESKRSKTLYLMKPRYNDFIRNVWLLHNIPNYIARRIDSVVDAGGWDTL